MSQLYYKVYIVLSNAHYKNTLIMRLCVVIHFSKLYRPLWRTLIISCSLYSSATYPIINIILLYIHMYFHCTIFLHDMNITVTKLLESCCAEAWIMGVPSRGPG